MITVVSQTVFTFQFDCFNGHLLCNLVVILIMPLERLYGESDWFIKLVTAQNSVDVIGVSPPKDESYEEWRVHNSAALRDVIVSRSVSVLRIIR